MSDSQKQPVWFLLVDAHGDAYKKANVDCVFIPKDNVIVQFKDAVHAKNPKKLSSCDASDLIVYENKAKLDENKPLDEEEKIAIYGGRKADALYVVVADEVISVAFTAYDALLSKRIKDLHEKLAEQQTIFWLVTGSVVKALSTIGVRARLYRMAGYNLGFYDPTIQSSESEKKAFWYDEDGSLLLHVIFETKEHALCFRRDLMDEKITVASPLNGLEMDVAEVSKCYRDSKSLPVRQIVSTDYDPNESESLQESTSQISSQVTLVDITSDLLRYQSIENQDIFLGGFGTAEAAHLMSKQYCTDPKNKRYKPYNTNHSNRLALSRDMHGFYDKSVPPINLKFISASEGRVVDNRYEVVMEVSFLKPEFKNYLQYRLKPGTYETEQGTLRTIVHVEDKNVFKECLEWKFKVIDAAWRNYFDMKPAVD